MHLPRCLPRPCASASSHFAHPTIFIFSLSRVECGGRRVCAHLFFPSLSNHVFVIIKKMFRYVLRSSPAHHRTLSNSGSLSNMVYADEMVFGACFCCYNACNFKDIKVMLMASPLPCRYGFGVSPFPHAPTCLTRERSRRLSSHACPSLAPC